MVDFETGWRSTREIWLTSFHDDALWPFALESNFVTTDEDGRSIGVHELRVISMERLPLDEALFEASGDRAARVPRTGTSTRCRRWGIAERARGGTPGFSLSRLD